MESKQKFSEQMQMSQSDPSTSMVDDAEDAKFLWRFIRISTLHFFSLAMGEFGRSSDDFVLFMNWIDKQYGMELTDEERKEIMIPFNSKNHSYKDRENLQQKYDRF